MDHRLKVQLEAAIMQLHPDYRDQGLRDLDAILASSLNTFEDLLSVARDPHADLTLRKMVVWFLGRLDNTDALPALNAALHDSQDEIRGESARALGTLASDEAIQLLIDALHHDPSPDVCMKSAYALGLIGGDQAVDALVSLLQQHPDASPKVRGMAAETLGNLHAEEAVDLLIASLDDPAVELRYWATFALGEIGDPRALTALQRLASTDHAILSGFGSVSQEAVQSIALITDATT